MKTITKEYNLYTFDELDQEAKDKARNKFNEHNDYPFLAENLREEIENELETQGYKIEDIKLYYSLSYCQGDGLMFEGKLTDKDGNIYTIKHRGHYYHERSTEITGEDKDGNEIDTEYFENSVYIPLCQRTAKGGYDEIEYQESEECFRETCEANDYTFLEDGTMFNA